MSMVKKRKCAACEYFRNMAYFNTKNSTKTRKNSPKNLSGEKFYHRWRRIGNELILEPHFRCPLPIHLYTKNLIIIPCNLLWGTQVFSQSGMMIPAIYITTLTCRKVFCDQYSRRWISRSDKFWVLQVEIIMIMIIIINVQNFSPNKNLIVKLDAKKEVV